MHTKLQMRYTCKKIYLHIFLHLLTVRSFLLLPVQSQNAHATQTVERTRQQEFVEFFGEVEKKTLPK